MMKIPGILGLIAVLFFCSCSGSDTPESISLKKGRYSYVMSDSSGKTLVEGMMMLDTISRMQSSRNYTISGSYTVSSVDTSMHFKSLAALNPGPLTAFYDDSMKTLNINTNPMIADANVFVNALVSSGKLNGTWYYSTFRGGGIEGGFFKATKQK
jgi:hypothetical protein